MIRAMPGYAWACTAGAYACIKCGVVKSYRVATVLQVPVPASGGNTYIYSTMRSHNTKVCMCVCVCAEGGVG